MHEPSAIEHPAGARTCAWNRTAFANDAFESQLDSMQVGGGVELAGGLVIRKQDVGDGPKICGWKIRGPCQLNVDFPGQLTDA
jgi:hypothetical protein